MTYPSLENCRLSIMLTHHATTFSGKIPFCENWIAEFFDNFDRGLKWVTSCRMIWIFKQGKFFRQHLRKMNHCQSAMVSMNEEVWKLLCAKKISLSTYVSIRKTYHFHCRILSLWKVREKGISKVWNLILELVVKWSANAHKSYSSPHAVAFRKE